MTGLQAISEYAAVFAQSAASTSRSVQIEVLDPPGQAPMTVTVDGSNAKILQIKDVSSVEKCVKEE